MSRLYFSNYKHLKFTNCNGQILRAQATRNDKGEKRTSFSNNKIEITYICVK